MKKGVVIGIIIVLALIAGVVFYYTYYGQNYKSPSTSSAEGNSIDISNFAFSNTNLIVKSGETVTWTNKDSTQHTITSDSGSELGSSPLKTGEVYSHTFNQAGVYSYHCSFHPGMKGKITVE